MGSFTNIEGAGTQGQDGKSAYQIWLEEGNVGTEQDFLNSLTAPPTFEVISKNLYTYPYVLNYTGDNLTSIVYTTDTGTITKTFAYTGDNLISITLSGDTPNGIDLIKTLTYTGENLTSIAYS